MHRRRAKLIRTRRTGRAGDNLDDLHRERSVTVPEVRNSKGEEGGGEERLVGPPQGGKEGSSGELERGGREERERRRKPVSAAEDE